MGASVALVAQRCRDAMANDVELNFKGMDRLIKAFKNVPTARVGILGSKDKREDAENPSNASIGAVHEFGGSGTVRRSFLREPISAFLALRLEKSKAFTPKVLKKVLQEQSIREWVAKIGITGEEIVGEAFDTQGWGQWKPSNMEHKENHQTLVETQQLRNSITSDVK